MGESHVYIHISSNPEAEGMEAVIQPEWGMNEIFLLFSKILNIEAKIALDPDGNLLMTKESICKQTKISISSGEDFVQRKHFERSYSICFTGPSEAGKSSIINRAIGGKFYNESFIRSEMRSFARLNKPYIGRYSIPSFPRFGMELSPEKHYKQFKDNSLIINASILDTFGNIGSIGNPIDFDSLTDEIHAIILVFSVKICDSLIKLKHYAKYFLKDYHLKFNNKPIIAIAGNKIDSKHRVISYEEGKAFADSLNCMYFEISAKNNFGINEMFFAIFYSIFENWTEINS